MKFDIGKIEKVAKGKDIASITVHYGKKKVTYSWDNRGVIKWGNVVRCRLNFEIGKNYNVNGENCRRPGLRIKGV